MLASIEGSFRKCYLVVAVVFASLPIGRASAREIVGVQNFQIISRLTGSPSQNQTAAVGVGGTDLGHMVNHNGKTYFLFGDTFAGETPFIGGDWRNNAMAWSTDFNPSNGITFDGWVTRPNGTAAQVLSPGSQPVTYIPTGAISVGDKIYAWYMHVSDWNGWTLSHAGLGWWREGDSQFTIVPDYSFENPAGGPYTTGNGTLGGNFGMVAASYRAPLENVDDEHLYIWGTPGGREGGVKLARVLPSQIEDLSAYRYFDGLAADEPQWTTSEYDGNKLIQNSVGEMSVMYNEALRAWTLMYISGGAQPDFEIRQAEYPWGPWSDPITVVDFSRAPGLYAPYMNPRYVEDNGETLYFTMSLWNPYDVYLAKVTLNSLPTVILPGDFNVDGTVNAADYVVWRKGLGTVYSRNDYAVWRAHFGRTLGSGASGVTSPNAAAPEPTSRLMLLLGMLTIFLQCRALQS